MGFLKWWPNLLLHKAYDLQMSTKSSPLVSSKTTTTLRKRNSSLLDPVECMFGVDIWQCMPAGSSRSVYRYHCSREESP